MTTGKLISQDEKLRKAISSILTDVIIEQSASDADIESGLYKPISKTARLLNLDKLFTTQEKAVVTIKPPPIYVIKK